MSKKKKYSFRTLLQELFLTYSFFIQNDLFTYASSCAFGLIFSFLPVLILTATILIRVLHTSPEVLISFLNQTDFFSNSINITEVVSSFLNIHGNIFFEIVIGVFLLLMARKLFNSVVKGFHCIFHTESKRRPLKWQLIIIAGEVILVVLLAVLIFIFSAANSLLDFSLIKELIPKFILDLINKLALFLPIIFMFFLIMITYKTASGTKPKWRICFICSSACTIIFRLFILIFSNFTDMTKYNLIYGILSNTIILLFEFFSFFVLYLFFAQALFVHQFFDQLLLAELYLLPNREETKLTSIIRRIMFIKPDYFIRSEFSLISYSANCIIFREGEETSDVYFIAEGTIMLSQKNQISHCDRGCFFGELSCILMKPREVTATSVTNVKLIKIEGETFSAMLEKNPGATHKVLSQISTYFKK